MQDNHTTNTVKLCECGCGQPAPIATKTDAKWGAIKGQARRFIHGHNNRQAADRFWERVDKRGPDECWLWQGSPGHYGYGTFSLNGQNEKPSRASWKLTYGSIPDNLHVLHKCDANYPAGDISYRACVNPAHLFLGTQADNMADMNNKGRRGYTGSPGESHPNAKLTERMVHAIRQRMAAGERSTQVAKDYGVTADTINCVARRKVWKHVR